MSPAPYPADTRAKGWRFELDHERIRQSDTWALAPAELRPWLLMLWMVAWEQTPCGSLPNDDALLIARLEMAPKAFHKARATLLRGWTAADDGRLYHATLTERVMEMIARRRKDAERRDRQRHGVTDVSHGTTPGHTPAVPATVNTGTSNTSNTPHTPQGGKAGVALKTWLDAVKAVGENPVPEGDAVFTYAAEVGIPHEFLRLAWLEFRHRYSQPDAKRYRDWRSVFRKAVRGNWLKLWFLDPASGQYGLTTTGLQAQRAHAEKKAA